MAILARGVWTEEIRAKLANCLYDHIKSRWQALRFPCSARLIKHKMANRRKNPNLSAYEKAKQEPHPTWIYQFVAPPTVRLRILKYKIRGML